MLSGNFIKIYESCVNTRHEYATKFMLMTFMVLVAVILLNMLIATMANTYQMVRDTDKEYLRQWAQVVLAIEHSMSKR